VEEYSVLMSVYYKEKAEYLRLAIDSMPNQTVKPADFVLVCDGPLVPELDALIAYYQAQCGTLLRTVRLPENKGLGFALNEGLAACRCELVARMDTDDIALQDRMEKQLELLDRFPQISAVGGQIAEFSGNPDHICGYRMVPQTPEDVKRRAGSRNPMNHMTVTFRKHAIVAAGGYQNVIRVEDYHLWVRMLDKGYQLSNIGDVCCNVRTDGNFYERRGGMAYFRNLMVVNRMLLSTGLISLFGFWRNAVVFFGGTVIISDRFRGWLYGKVLRKTQLQKMPEGGE
jgi:glycosyltransferase involved in cell wall biosynthesis